MGVLSNEKFAKSVEVAEFAMAALVSRRRR